MKFLKNYFNAIKGNPAHKSFKAANLCLDEWHENYNNPDMPECNHNRILPKVAFGCMFALLVFTLIILA